MFRHQKSFLYLLVVLLELGSIQRVAESYLFGKDADFLEWPWQVLIITGPKDWNICGGTILNENYILTAAHCVRDSEGQNPLSYKLVFGEHDRSKHEGTEVEIDVGEVIKFPQYEAQNHSYDMALVKLKTPLDFIKYSYLRPVCLALQYTNLRGLDCVGTGWGRLGESGKMPNVLQKLEMKVSSRRHCADLHQHFYSRGPSFERVIFTHVCMVSKTNPDPESGSSYGAVCGGDSGGPLHCQVDKVWYQIGVAWSNTDCEQNPSVYNLVYKYADWIITKSKYVLPAHCVTKGATIASVSVAEETPPTRGRIGGQQSLGQHGL